MILSTLRVLWDVPLVVGSSNIVSRASLKLLDLVTLSVSLHSTILCPNRSIRFQFAFLRLTKTSQRMLDICVSGSAWGLVHFKR